MKIAFDAKRAFQNHTGLGNYSRYILDILCRYFPENDYIAYAPHRRDEPAMQRLLDAHPVLSARFPEGRQWGTWWRTFGITSDLQNDGVDLYQGLSGELPLNIKKAGIPSVVTIHDLIFLRFPKLYPLIDRKIYAYKMRRACQNATHIIAISECTKRDIMHFFGISAEKITVVYQGCDPAFTTVRDDEAEAEVRRRYQLPERFMLCVGSIEERKNAGLLVKALPHIASDVSLVLIGKPTPYTKEVQAVAEKLGVAHRLHIHHHVPFADLPTIYRMAEVFAYPSRYEGFGIPILEALRSGVPVVAATGSCLEEAGGKGALYVHPDDHKALADAVDQILDEPATRDMLLREGAKHALSFQPHGQATQFMQVLKKAYQVK